MRNKTIDFLRGIAIVLTLFRHAPYQGVFIKMRQVGWIGVDLFFVLSGFLVSGLIFDEYKKNKTFNAKQFLIRRGFKIYPSFWIFIIFTIIYKIYTDTNIDYIYILRDFLFIQNYFHDYNHTWSLCVEEHFYFLIVLFFILIIKYSRNVNKTISILAMMVILYGILIKAYLFFQNGNFTNHTHLFPTHLRIDSLMIGLLIAHVYRNYRHFIEHIKKFQIIYFAATVLGLSIPLVLNIDKPSDQLYLTSFGLPIISMSFGLLLILLLEYNNFEKILSRFISKNIFKVVVKVGFYSYSIYLWHILCAKIACNFLNVYLPELNGYILVFIYFVLCIFTGIILGKLIEIPFLKIRDSYFPKN